MGGDFLKLAICSALMAAASVRGAGAEAISTSCVEASQAAAERVIEDCDALLMDQATAEATVPGIFLARAEAFVRQGRLRLALDDLANVIERRPDDARAFFKRAELHRALGDSEAAISGFGEVIRLEPKNVPALLARGELHRSKTDRRRALADYAAALRLDPSNEAASANYKALAQEIERLGVMMPVQPPQR
jgi:tetratricopeptide (TPR) repeat protein